MKNFMGLGNEYYPITKYNLSNIQRFMMVDETTQILNQVINYLKDIYDIDKKL